MTFLLEFSDKSKTEVDELYKRYTHIGFEIGHEVAPRMNSVEFETWSKYQSSMTKVITVRHPFERLVSAFRQKMEAKAHIPQGWEILNNAINRHSKNILLLYKVFYSM